MQWGNMLKIKMRLNKFYKVTPYFWVISRIVLMILLGASLLGRISQTTTPYLVINAVFLLVIFSMMAIIIGEFSKREVHYSWRLIAGILVSLFGVLISYLLLTYIEKEYALITKIGFQLLPLWMILYGIFEIKLGIRTLSNSSKN